MITCGSIFSKARALVAACSNELRQATTIAPLAHPAQRAAAAPIHGRHIVNTPFIWMCVHTPSVYSSCYPPTPAATQTPTPLRHQCLKAAHMALHSSIQSIGVSMQAAIDSMTRSLALEWGYYGIRVSGIAPGWIGDTTGNSISSHVASVLRYTDNHYC